MELIFKFFSIFVLGFIGGITPGPVLTASFTESLRKGFLKSLPIIFMAMISEIIIALFILTVLFSINIPESIFYIFSFIGAGVLVWLAMQIWKIKNVGGEGEVFDFKKIFILMLFNGSFWIFWITVCVPQAFLLRKDIEFGQFLFLIIFELGWLIATISLVFIFSRFRLFLIKNNFVPIVFKIFSIILVYFAINLLFESFRYFIK
ncbi:MAG: LysE family transporter [Candidatus Paceibacterota bacterium]